MGAKCAKPGSDIWLLYGDGAAGFSLFEFDTFVRHELPVIAVVGNDAGWTQILRDQLEWLGDDTGCRLRHTAYHEVARGFGAEGLLIEKNEQVEAVLKKALSISRKGKPVLINAILSPSEFRKGSLSI